MPEPHLEEAIFFMIRTYLDSELASAKEVNKILQRLQYRVVKYDAQFRPAMELPENKSLWTQT